MTLTGKSMFMAKKGSSYEVEKAERKKQDVALKDDGTPQDRKTYIKETLARIMADNDVRYAALVAREAAEEAARKYPPQPPTPPVEPPTTPVEPPTPPVEPPTPPGTPNGPSN